MTYSLISPPETTALRVRMDDNWWDAFLDHTDHLTRPLVMRKALDADDVGYLQRALADALRTGWHDQSGVNNWSLSLAGEAKKADYRAGVAAACPLHPGEDLTSWAGRAFGAQRFNVVIHHPEVLSDELARELAVRLAPLLDKTGVSVGGLRLSAYVGNEGPAPRIAQPDRRRMAALYLHLGPAPAGDGRGPGSEGLPLQAGDLCFAPTPPYPGGQVHGLAAGLTLWMDYHQVADETDQLLETIKSGLGNAGEKAITTPERAADNFAGFVSLRSLLQDSPFPAASLPALLGDVYRQSMMKVLSNGGWRLAPRPGVLAAGVEQGNYEYLLGKQVQLVYPFKLYYQATAKAGGLLYCRGAEVESSYHPGLRQIIQMLNTHRAVPVSDLLAYLDGWPQEAGLYLLSVLHEKRGLILASPERIAEPRTAVSA